MPCLGELPHPPADGAVAPRNDDRGLWRDQLFDIHLGIEFDDEAAGKGFTELGLDLGRHRAGLGAQDQKAGRSFCAALWGSLCWAHTASARSSSTIPRVARCIS